MHLMIAVMMISSAALAQGDKQEDFKGIDLFKIQQADPYPAGIVQRIIDGLVPNKKDGKSKREFAQAAGLHAYRAEILDPRKHKPSQVNLLVVRLAAPFVGGRLAVAVDDLGDIIAMDLMGHPGLSKDNFSVWFTFLLQFMSNPMMGTEEFRLRDSSVESADPTVEPQAKKPKKKGRKKSLRRFMASQRHAMKSNRLLLFHLQRAVRGGENIPPDWFERQAEVLDELRRDAGALRKVLSKAQIAQYRKHLGEAIAGLNKLKADASQGVLDMEAFKDGARELSRSCKRCHEAASPEDSASLQNFLASRREALALPTGLLEIGYDVALAPGLAEDAGHSIADALRTALRVDAKLPKK